MSFLQTSERRQAELSFYLKELLYTDSRISESDVVYTFLHCLLRDEQDLLKMREGLLPHSLFQFLNSSFLSEESTTDNSIAGRVKLDLQYSEEQERLSIMVRHVRELVCHTTTPYPCQSLGVLLLKVPRDGTESMDPYVKLYLLPDPKKCSKQKTKIARKTLNPTYNQMVRCCVNGDTACVLVGEGIRITIIFALNITNIMFSCSHTSTSSSTTL